MLKVSLFGSGRACYENSPLPGFPVQQPCLLLCYLLLNQNHPHSRDKLAGIFWGDTSNSLARKQLRNTIWRLRQYLLTAGAEPEDYLFVCEESISFLSTSKYWFDIALFETAIGHCRDQSGKELKEEQVHELGNAVDLYVGDLLNGVYEDWCLYDRERLRLAYVCSLGKLMEYHGFNGNYKLGLEYGEKILAVDSTREKVHQQMMWLHFLAGDRSAALKQFNRCQQVLLDELGIVPLDETRRLREIILHSPTRSKNTPLAYGEIDQHRIILNRHDEPFTQSALEKLHYLQMMVDHASAELRLLERIICNIWNQPDSGEDLESPQ